MAHKRSNPLTAPIPKGSALAQFTLTMLILEILVVLFAGVAAFGLRVASPGVIWTVTGTGMLFCLIAAIAVRRKPQVGLILGSIAQAVVLATAIWLPEGFVVGITFLILWIAAIYWGAKLDRERDLRRYEQAEWERENLHAGDAPAEGTPSGEAISETETRRDSVAENPAGDGSSN